MFSSKYIGLQKTSLAIGLATILITWNPSNRYCKIITSVCESNEKSCQFVSRKYAFHQSHTAYCFPFHILVSLQSTSFLSMGLLTSSLHASSRNLSPLFDFWPTASPPIDNFFDEGEEVSSSSSSSSSVTSSSNSPSNLRGRCDQYFTTFSPLCFSHWGQTHS